MVGRWFVCTRRSFREALSLDAIHSDTSSRGTLTAVRKNVAP